MEFEIPNLSSEMLSEIKGMSSVVSVVQEKDTHLKVRTRGENTFDALLEVIRKHGGKIRTVRNLEPTLEDVFIHLTGREMREETSSKNSTGRRHRRFAPGRVR